MVVAIGAIAVSRALRQFWRSVVRITMGACFKFLLLVLHGFPGLLDPTFRGGRDARLSSVHGFHNHNRSVVAPVLSRNLRLLWTA